MKSFIQLGDKVRCKVTGLTGIATARCEYINGCVQFGITPPAKGGKTMDTCYTDQKQIEVIKSQAVIVRTELTGGPMNCPKH
jgi:hypothetical protein